TTTGTSISRPSTSNAGPNPPLRRVIPSTICGPKYPPRLPTLLMKAIPAAAGIAFINSVGNLGGYFGPQIVEGITRLSGGFGPALLVLGLEMLVPVVVVLIISRRRPSRS